MDFLADINAPEWYCPEECSKAITTKPSSMSGRTKKYTWRDVDTGRKPATAGEAWGRKRS
jgi:hypothetical protein